MLQCFFLILLSRFVMLHYCFVRNTIVLCILMLLCNDTTLFYRLQYCDVSYYIILECDNAVFCLVIIFCVLSCCFVLLQYFFVIL